MEIQSLNPNASITREGDVWILNFGNIPLSTDTTTKLVFSGSHISRFTLTPTCKCSVSEVTKIDVNTWNGTIQYKDTHIKGAFPKTFTMAYTELGEAKHGQIKLRGTVV